MTDKKKLFEKLKQQKNKAKQEEKKYNNIRKNIANQIQEFADEVCEEATIYIITKLNQKFGEGIIDRSDIEVNYRLKLRNNKPQFGPSISPQSCHRFAGKKRENINSYLKMYTAKTKEELQPYLSSDHQYIREMALRRLAEIENND